MIDRHLEDCYEEEEEEVEEPEEDDSLHNIQPKLSKDEAGERLDEIAGNVHENCSEKLPAANQ